MRLFGFERQESVSCGGIRSRHWQKDWLKRRGDTRANEEDQREGGSWLEVAGETESHVSGTQLGTARF